MVSGRVWRVALLGGLRLEGNGDVVTRFRSHKTGGLLAYLALFPRRAHTREEMADLFWPDADPEAGRTNLRSALASLRRQLEPPGVEGGSVLVTRGHSDVLLNPQAYETDVDAFERALRGASRPDTPLSERTRLLSEAVTLYGGPLLPGHYEDWALTERGRLAERYVGALRDLAHLHEEAGDWPQALEAARRALTVDPLAEEAHLDVLRLLTASGQSSAAKRHYAEMERLFNEQLGVEPPQETRDLLEAPPAAPRSCAAGPKRTNALVGDSSPASVVSSTSPAPNAEPRSETPVHLPLTLTRFFGREDEKARICESLTSGGASRLLTLTGAGGSGKTRLAIEAARETGGHFPGGVWFVPLADATQAERLWDAAAAALSLPPAPQAPTAERVITALLGRSERGPVLLVLDNFEQIVEEGAGCVAQLLGAVPTLSCLVTSRQRLLLDGEYEIPVSPLPTPLLALTPSQLMGVPSVQLFVSRAQAARPDFQINERNAAIVAQLCRHLEGIPLALELAAAWAQTLSPAQMLQRLARRFDLLVSRRRDVPGRHATLRATLEWSYQLLPGDLKRFFSGLSVFSGGWTLEAAEQVLDQPLALEYMAELQDRSLIVRAETSERGADSETPPRFRMLETLREFADEQVAPEERATLTQRHADFCVALAEASREHLIGPASSPWLDRLEAEHDNFRAVLDRYAMTDSELTALRLAAALGRFWEIRGHWREGRTRLDAVLAQDTPCGPILRRALQAAAALGRFLSDYDAVDAYAQRGLACAQQDDDDASAASFLTLQGLTAQYRGDYDKSRRSHEASLSRSRRLDDLTASGVSLHNLGRLSELQGDHQAAAQQYQEAADIFHAQGNRRYEANSLNNLGNCHYLAGNRDAARRIYENCLEIQRETGDLTGGPITLFNLGSLALGESDLAGAAEHYRQSLRAHWEQGNKRHVCFGFEGLAAVARRQGDWGRAARLLGAADLLRGLLQASTERGELELNPPDVRAEVQGPQHRQEWEAGRRMPLGQAVEYALESMAIRVRDLTEQEPAQIERPAHA